MPLPKLIRDKTNREIISWLAGGAVVIITGLWAAFVYIFPPKHEEGERSGAEANCGGIAIGGNVTSATITAGTSDCSTK
jgi:hypothetical protein